MSHTRLLYHVVFATKGHLPLIGDQWAADLYAYLAGIINNLGGDAIEINGVADHIHLLLRLDPQMSVSDVLRDLKASSSKWAKRHQPKFAWQRRYGAFTVSESIVPRVRQYIRHQKVHHSKQSLNEEFRILLRRHGLEPDDRNIWD